MTLVAVFCLLGILQNLNYVSHVCNSPSSVSNSNIVALSSRETPSSDGCRTYHVALIVATADEARDASFLLRTLLYHQMSPIHLHLLVNNFTHHIMKTLTDTWELNQVSVDLYKVNSTLSHSHTYWLTLKFRLSEFIASTNVREVVYLGNDVRLLCDISGLWKEVEGVDRDNRFIGLVTNGNCDNGREFCYTDKILLVDLNRFHQSTLHTTLRAAKTKSETESILGQHLHDSIFSIPCSWAIALNPKRGDFNCTQFSGPVRGLVLSGSESSFVSNPILEKAREHIVSVLSSEPSTIVPNNCQTSPNDSLKPSNDICAKFQNAAYLRRRTHLYYLGDGGVIGDQVSRDPYEVRLLTQLTLDRFGVLERFLGLWEGPATIVLHLTDAEAMELPRKVRESKVLRNRKAVTYHIVYKRQVYNPINYLRNVALNNSHSPYLLFVDVDLIPNQGLYTSLKRLVKIYMNKENNDTVLVVPAFQMFIDLGHATPKNKSQLLVFMPNRTVVGYGMLRSWNLGHKPTNYGRWVSAEKPYQAVFADAFEPYVIVRRDCEARYNELLLERMADKIGYVRLLHGQGFKFFVVPDDFIIHVPHPISPGSTRFYQDGNYVRCSSRFFEAYRKELYHRFPKIKF